MYIIMKFDESEAKWAASSSSSSDFRNRRSFADSRSWHTAVKSDPLMSFDARDQSSMRGVDDKAYHEGLAAIRERGFDGN